MFDSKDLDYSRFLSMYHGLELEPGIAEYDKRHNENGILYFTQVIKLKQALGVLEEEDIFIFNQICDRLRTYKSDGSRCEGLFDRGGAESADINNRNFRTLSHDNLTAISAFSEIHNEKRAIEIAKHGIKNFMIYDNVSPENPRLLYKDPRNGKLKTRLQHPRDWFFWLHNAGGIYSLLSFLFLPIFFFANIISCGTEYEETSGKLMAFTRLFGSNKLIYKINWFFCKRRLEKTYGKKYLTKITEIYYKHPEHPVRVLASLYEQSN